MNFTELGYFSKTHGIKGQLNLKCLVELDLDNFNAVFLDSSTGKAPYFVEEWQETPNGLLVKLEEINSIEVAKKLVGKKVYVDEKLVIQNNELVDWVGFELVDNIKGSLGLIKTVSDNGAQIIIGLNYNNKELLLPLVEEFITKVDEEKKIIFFNSPEGLIDLYS